MVTTESMRQFSIDCLKWAEQYRNPSDRETILGAARSWLATAEAIERYLAHGRGQGLRDLREKLN
jgi:hypothetical protein